VRLIRDIFKLQQVDQRIESAEAELQTAQVEQLKLKDELLKVNSQSWQEEQFRNTLKMARSNETIVVVPEEITSFGASQESLTDENMTLLNWQKWWQLFVW
jgi:cell division protein FtsB